MATVTSKARCVTCNKEKSPVICSGCQQTFCRSHFTDHCQELNKELDEIEVNRDLFRQTLNEQINHPQKHALIKQIDQWENESIQKIQQTAKEGREILLRYTTEHFHRIEIKLAKLTDEIRETRHENDYNEIDINQLKQKLIKLAKDLDQLPNIAIQKDGSPFLSKISVVVYSGVSPPSCVNTNSKWKQYGTTIAGGNNEGNELDQLCHPYGICVDGNQDVYIADDENHRIVQWKCGANIGQIIAGGTGEGRRLDQLSYPTNMVIDKINDSIIICDSDNRRVMRWPRQNGTTGQIIISNIGCSRIAKDNNEHLYISDKEKHEVRRYKIDESDGIIVAGGNGQGNRLNQLNFPTYIFVDEEDSVYISDRDNHRVVRWIKDAREGIVVAGGNDEGNSLKQLDCPQGLFVDHFGNVYVADSGNHRIMCWSKGSNEGRIVLGGNGSGQRSNQFRNLADLTFDRQGNLYVVDFNNHRIQKFDIDSN